MKMEINKSVGYRSVLCRGNFVIVLVLVLAGRTKVNYSQQKKERYNPETGTFC